MPQTTSLTIINSGKVALAPSALRPVTANQVFLVYLKEELVLNNVFRPCLDMSIILYQDIAPYWMHYIHSNVTLLFEKKLHTFLLFPITL